MIFLSFIYEVTHLSIAAVLTAQLLVTGEWSRAAKSSWLDIVGSVYSQNERCDRTFIQRLIQLCLKHMEPLKKEPVIMQRCQ